MAGNKIIRVGPVALTTTLTTNILNPPGATGGVGIAAVAQYIILRHIRIVNRTSSPATYSLFIGATGGNVSGTEFMGTNSSVGPNSYVDWYGAVRLDAADFLVGGANTATALTIQAEGEIGVAG